MTGGLLFAALGLLAAAAADPSIVSAPSFKVGDTWVFDQTDQHGANRFDQQRLDLMIERTGAETMLVGLKRDGVPGGYEDHVLGADWSIRRVVNGQDMASLRPLAFPMNVGQTWTVDFTDPTRRGAQTSLHVHRTYKVVGWEDITVPAGTFHAIKVEASGLDEAVFDVPTVAEGRAMVSPAGGATAITHSQHGGAKLVNRRSHDELYYVPAVKNFVKSVEEQYNSDEVLVSRETRILASFQPGA